MVQVSVSTPFRFKCWRLCQQNCTKLFYVLLAVHLGIIFVNNQADAQLFSCMFISILYMFRAAMCPSSGELIVSIRHLVYVTLYRWPFSVQVWMRLQSSLIQTCTLNGHPYSVTYTRCRIDTINSPDDGHMDARNMYRIEINIYEKELCVNLVIYKDCIKRVVIMI